MATVAEEQLPDALIKLNISENTPTSATVNNNNKQQQQQSTNPFEYEYTDESNLHSLLMKTLHIKEANTTTITTTAAGTTLASTNKPHRCHRCTMRNHRGEHDMDDLQKTLCSTDFFKKHQHHGTTTTLNGGIQKQTLKNTIIARGQCRNVLREPILNHLSSAACRRCSLQQSVDGAGGKGAGVGGGVGGAPDGKDGKTSQKLSQVSLAVDDCCKLVAGRLQDLPDFNVCFCKRCKKTQKLPNNNNNNNKRNTMKNLNACEDEAAATSAITANNFSQLTVSNNNNNNNTSCSQQAGNGMVPGGDFADDVTINELACYFDHMVYIPKKMSQMAEMMYI